MKQETNKENQTPPASKTGMSDFRKGMFWTAIPVFVLSVVSMVIVIISGILGSGFLWIGGLLYFLGAIIALVVFIAMHKRQVAVGILAGIGISIVSLGATCFASLNLR